MSRLLFVCRANVCRSVLAENLVRSKLAGRLEVGSGGVSVHLGTPACPDVLDRLQHLGIEPIATGAQPVTSARLRAADLVLVTDLAQRSEVARRHLAARERVFSLLEVAWLTRGRDFGDVESVAEFAQRLNALRPTTPPPRAARPTLFNPSPPHPLDIPDGHVGSRRTHRQALSLVEDAVEELLVALGAIKELR